MNAPIVKSQFDFSLGNLSYIGPSYDDAPAWVAEPQKRPSGGWMARLVAKFTEWQHRRAVLQEMAMMTDRELSDIGLSRADLTRVFDPAFVADRAHGRDYIAY